MNKMSFIVGTSSIGRQYSHPKHFYLRQPTEHTSLKILSHLSIQFSDIKWRLGRSLSGDIRQQQTSDRPKALGITLAYPGEGIQSHCFLSLSGFKSHLGGTPTEYPDLRVPPIEILIQM